MPTDHRSRSPQFSLKQLLLSTALIAAGIPAYAFYATDDAGAPEILYSFPVLLTLWFGSGACIGAGLFGLFNKPWVGAVVGCLGAFGGAIYAMWGVLFDMP